MVMKGIWIQTIAMGLFGKERSGMVSKKNNMLTCVFWPIE